MAAKKKKKAPTRKPAKSAPAKPAHAFKLTVRPPAERAGKTLRAGCPRTLLEPIEIASRDEIAGLQLKRLKWTLAHAYRHVPHYRRKLDAAGVHPSDLKRLEDLAKFPFTTKDDLRETYPYGMFAVPREKVLRIHASRYGRMSARARCALLVHGRATSCTSPTATACSPAVSARTTRPSGSAAR